VLTHRGHLILQKDVGFYGNGAGATIMKPEITGIQKTERSLTWGVSPVVCAAISKTIDVIDQGRRIEKNLDKSKYMVSRLSALAKDYSFISKPIGAGFMLGRQWSWEKNS
jgi:4-aminobutyrate aminotransferase-like enzyme